MPFTLERKMEISDNFKKEYYSVLEQLKNLGDSIESLAIQDHINFYEKIKNSFFTLNILEEPEQGWKSETSFNDCTKNIDAFLIEMRVAQDRFQSQLRIGEKKSEVSNILTEIEKMITILENSKEMVQSTAQELIKFEKEAAEELRKPQAEAAKNRPIQPTAATIVASPVAPTQTASSAAAPVPQPPISETAIKTTLVPQGNPAAQPPVAPTAVLNNSGHQTASVAPAAAPEAVLPQRAPSVPPQTAPASAASKPEAPKPAAVTPETPQAPPTPQQIVLNGLEMRWNEFVEEMRKKSPSEKTNEKLENIYQYCKKLDPKVFLEVVTSEGMYDDVPPAFTYVPMKNYFFRKLVTSKSSEYVLKILSVIPLEHRYNVLDKSFKPMRDFISWWTLITNNREPVIVLELTEYLDDKTKNIFFEHIADTFKHQYFLDFWQGVTNEDTFERLFLMRCEYYARHNGLMVDPFVQKFLELTDSKPQQRKNLIAKIDPKIREVFVQALPQNEVPTRKPTSTSETNQATLLPDMSSPTPHTTESKPGTTVPDSMAPRVSTPGAVVPPAGSKKMYWLMGAVIVAAIILSVLYANLLIAGCVAGGGLLAMGALWFFKSRGDGAGKPVQAKPVKKVETKLEGQEESDYTPGLGFSQKGTAPREDRSSNHSLKPR